MAKVKNKDFFDIMVDYYINKIYRPKCRQKIVEGVLNLSSEYENGQKNIITGETELDQIKGLYKGLLIACGTLSELEAMINNGTVEILDIHSRNSTETKESLFDKIEEESKRDGAMYYSTDTKELFRIGHYNIGIPSTYSLPSYLPEEYYRLHTSNLQPLSIAQKLELLGTKTRAAIRISAMYNLPVFQIRTTVAGTVGLGVLTEYSSFGLKKLFYFDTAEDNEVVFDPEKKIAGRLIVYEGSRDSPILVERFNLEENKGVHRFVKANEPSFFIGRIYTPYENPCSARTL
ncbi:MAG: hypothetical protein QXK37_05015 [Candidatus Woesearchaeota archaeon]